MTLFARAALALFALLALGSPCSADYSPLRLYDMLGSSDVVVVGTIGEVKAESFVLTVETNVAGAEGKKTLEVQRFQDWTCASRWSPYETGQRVLVCAARVKGEDGVERFQIRSAGGEGEMPIDDGRVRLCGLDAPRAKSSEARPKVEELVKTIQAFRRCFKMTLVREGYPRLAKVEQTATGEDLEAFRASSKLAEALAASALERVARD